VEDRPLQNEATLVERAKRGDGRAYEELMMTHEAVAFRTAYLITRDAGEAEDAVQEAFFRAYKALHRFREAAPFRPWILRIVANEAKNRRKATARRSALALRDSRRPSGDAVPSPEAAVLDADFRTRVLRAIDALPDHHRLVVAYRYILDLSEEETAAALDCPLGTVKSRLSRARDELRDALEGLS
jgi:RNA polymerase sigma factor (sigma-70 family)